MNTSLLEVIGSVGLPAKGVPKQNASQILYSEAFQKLSGTQKVAQVTILAIVSIKLATPAVMQSMLAVSPMLRQVI